MWSPHSEKQNSVLFSDKRITIAGTGIQWGKCLISSTKILTSQGYIKASEIKIGDILYDRDGLPTRVTGVFPQGLKDCYRVDLTDRKSFTASDDHLNIIKRRGYAKEEIVTTKDLYERKCIWEGKSKPQIPSVKPIQFSEKEYFISPYIMGCLLGDGGLTISIVLSSIDDSLVKRVREELPIGFKIEKKGNSICDWSITNNIRQHNEKGYCVNKIIDELKYLGIHGKKSNAKFIPHEYKLGSIKQRLDVLRGLMDTDGTIEKNRKMEFYSISKNLADDVIYLVESLGGKAWKDEKRPFFTHNGKKKEGQLCYRVNIISPLHNPFWLKRKAEKYFVHENTPNKLIKHVEQVGKMDCICFSVDSPTKTFVIEGQIVTHNTSVGVIRLKMAMHTYTDPLDNFLVCSPTYKILNQSTLPPFLDLNKSIGTYNKKDDVFRIKGGGSVYFRSGRDPDAVVGITNVRAILCDEAGKYSRYFWDNIQARSSFKQAPITIVTSPYSLNWLYKDFIRPYQRGNEYIKSICHIVQATSKDNPYFPSEEYELRKRTMEPRRFNMIYGGNFEKADGLVYSIFNEDTMVVDPFEFPPGTEFYGGIDWGFTHPAVIIIRAVLPTGLHVEVAEFHKSGHTINDLARICQGFNSIYPVKRYLCDPAEPDSISVLCQKGITAVAANNSIRIGIDNHWDLINSGNYKVLRSSCPHLLDEYEQYHYPELKDLNPDQDEIDELPVDQFNHCMDVARYISMDTYKPRHRHNKIVVNGNEFVQNKQLGSSSDPRRLLKKSNTHFNSL